MALFSVGATCTGKACVRRFRTGDAVRRQGGEAPSCWLSCDGFFCRALLPVGFVLAASFTGALVSGVAQSGGMQIRPTAMELKFPKLNPVTNLGNLFSLRSATRMVKSLVPAAVMVDVGMGSAEGVDDSDAGDESAAIAGDVLSGVWTGDRCCMGDAGVVGLDYAIEWRSWNQRLKMSKQEMREEMRDAMGNPQIKAKIRQIQRAMRKRKVKADMSRASVVITNPTHYAVALEFSFETMSGADGAGKGTRSAWRRDS